MTAIAARTAEAPALLAGLALELGLDPDLAGDLHGLTPEELEALLANVRADLELAARATVEARNRRVRNREANLSPPPN